jgi:hypothetical protein
MLKTGLFDHFKGAKTLLLWGDGRGMTGLLLGLSALRNPQGRLLSLDEGNIPLSICSVAGPASWSNLKRDGEGLRWECSGAMLELAEDLVRPLIEGAGHQYLEVTGEAEQVIISRDEYPADLR